MKIRISLEDEDRDGYPGDFVLAVDYLTHNKLGHCDGQVLALKPNGCIEFGFIGGDTDVASYRNYTPRAIWNSLHEFAEDDEINDIEPKLSEVFIRYAYVTQTP